MQKKICFVLFLGALTCPACEPASDDEPVCGDSCQLAQASSSGPLARRLAEEFDRHYAELEGLSYADLCQQHAQSYLPALGFEVADALHYADFLDAFDLSEQAQTTLDQLGFVVVPAPARAPSMTAPTAGAGPADVYYRVFAADLPVFISADSVLHAWHRSYDELLEQSETAFMIPTLSDLLAQTMSALDAAAQDGRDALVYLAVARCLLHDDYQAPASVRAEVDRFLDLVASKQMVEVEFLGQWTWIDFSQFIPRGHYTHTEQLERYFLAMMWLGRTDLVLYSADPQEPPRPREEAAARAMAAAMQAASATPLFERMDRFYAAYVGKTNALTPTALLALCARAGLEACQGDAAGMQAVYAEQPPPEYSSRVFAGELPPICMRFFPQRFGYGSWVTSQTTTPRLEPAVEGGRAMAMVEDVAFALGSSRAVEYFAEDMQLPYRENLPATLEAARRTVQAIPPSELDPTTYNFWLDALIALGAPSLDPGLPQVMRTAVWHDRKLEAVLASWAELRHDTILIVEQSTGGIGCQYPLGYVEPVPALYRSLAAAAAALRVLYLDDEMAGFGSVPEFLSHFESSMATLARLADRELAGQPMLDEELDFLNQTVDLHGTSYYGARVYDGWYPRLFWTRFWNPEYPDGFEDDPSGISEPTVADVHTDAECGLALEVGVAHPGLMIVAIDNGPAVSLYGGPVASFFDFHVGLSERMTDEQWYEQVEGGSLPPRPDFAQNYWAD
ncbi:MAG: DUF3160 domain-containing protein [Deltaproteobacteria bacterium]|nr:DUF3160 domain-containing protein [Deltaproteobacteria bacterium]